MNQIPRGKSILPPKEEEEAIERVSSSMKRDGIRVGSDSFVVNGGKN